MNFFFNFYQSNLYFYTSLFFDKIGTQCPQDYFFFNPLITTTYFGYQNFSFFFFLFSLFFFFISFFLFIFFHALSIIFNFYNNNKIVYQFYLIFTFLILFLSTYLIFFIYLNKSFYILLFNSGYLNLISINFYIPLTFIDLNFSISYDFLNIFLIWLTNLLTFLCILFSLSNKDLAKIFYDKIFWFVLSQYTSLQFFLSTNYLWMYIFFELSLLPIFVIIIKYSKNYRRIHAAYQMVLFTLAGSIFLLLGIILLFFKFNTLNFFVIQNLLLDFTNNNFFSLNEKKVIWLFLFVGFAIKVPLYPFHIWLPEAHSEAPTEGSVFLAGILLKMGTYGILRFVFTLFSEINVYYYSLIFSICLTGIIYSSLSALVQVDMKRIIAYSSIGHMSYCILAIFSLNSLGLLGSSFMMISHGIVSAALFFCIGSIYKIYGTRILLKYNSLSHFMPYFTLFFFLFTLNNMGFPGTVAFPAEIFIFSSLIQTNVFFAIFSTLGSLFCGIYSIWLYTRISYGQLFTSFYLFKEINFLDKNILLFLSFLSLLFGIYPIILVAPLEFFSLYI